MIKKQENKGKNKLNVRNVINFHGLFSHNVGFVKTKYKLAKNTHINTSIQTAKHFLQVITRLIFYVNIFYLEITAQFY